VAKVRTSNLDRTISLEGCRAYVENKHILRHKIQAREEHAAPAAFHPVSSEQEDKWDDV
jgi:hypothetical protein